ncbi:hypothetical protein BX600DRAFT_455117 [Xylariales sp. PMI_506]|nr:hypothetical protein BX600DRAFT_455117 [Xylariales sp. PMI_506]
MGLLIRPALGVSTDLPRWVRSPWAPGASGILGLRFLLLLIFAGVMLTAWAVMMESLPWRANGTLPAASEEYDGDACSPEPKN